MQKRTVCKCKIAMSQCHSVSSLDSVPHCWRVSCIGSEVVAYLECIPKYMEFNPKPIPKRGVGQFCPRLLPQVATTSTAKNSPVCPSGGDQHYKASGPLSMLYQCQYGWVRESTAAIVMVRPYVLLQCLRAGPSCSQRLLPPSSCCLSPPPLVPQEISRANPLSCLQGYVSYVNRYCWSVLILSLPSKMKSLLGE